MKSCTMIADQMSLYVDGQLTDSQKTEFEAHLAQCPGCAQALEELQQLMGEMRNLQELELPADFHRETMEKIWEVKRPRRTYDFGKYAAAVAGVLLSILLMSGIGAGLSSLQGVQSSTQSMPEAEVRQMALTADRVTADEISQTEGHIATDEMLQIEEHIETSEASPAMEQSSVMADQDRVLIFSDEIAEGTNTDTVMTYAGGKSGESTIKNFSISLQVDDMDEAMRVINSLNGYNINAWSNLLGDTHRANVTRKVDAAQYEAIIEQLQTLGEVTNRHESEQIIENQKLDTEARLRAKEEEKERLFAMLTKAAAMDVMVMVEGRLSQVDHDIDYLKTTLMNLNGETSMAVIHVDLYARGPGMDESAVQSGQLARRISQSFISSLNLTIRAMENIVVFLSQILFPILILLVPALLVWLVRRRLAGRRESDEEK